MSTLAPLRLLLLMLSAPAAQVALAVEEAPGDVMSTRQVFNAIPPYLAGTNKAAERAVGDKCVALDVECFAYVDEHPDVLRALVPDNPAYWAAYAAVLSEGPVPVEQFDPQDDHAPALVKGVKLWLWRELMSNRIADAARLHEQVSAHRRGLATANVLIDKMVYLATTGLVLGGVNVHMARQDVYPSAAHADLLDDMLKPLDRDELSLRLALQGEIQLVAEGMKESPEPDRSAALLGVERLHEFVADRSEASWQDFWTDGVDIAPNVDLPSDFYLYVGDWSGYAIHPRLLDASLHVLRALREMYEGRVSPGPPVTEAPYGSSWRWEAESQTLCLDLGYVHASVAENRESICHQYLTPADVAVTLH